MNETYSTHGRMIFFEQIKVNVTEKHRIPETQ